MEGKEKFLLYSNRKTNNHVFTYVSPEGKTSTIKSKDMNDWDWRMSGHHALVRAAYHDAVGSSEWEELLRTPWMKRNEEPNAPVDPWDALGA
jgi:hypothetical protein